MVLKFFHLHGGHLWGPYLVGVQNAGEAATVTRQIVGVAAGSQDTDAVNVAQLKKLDTKIEKHRVHYFAVYSDH